MVVELDRLVKLLVEKLLRSPKKTEPNGSGTGEGEAAEHKLQERVPEEAAKDETDKKKPEG